MSDTPKPRAGADDALAKIVTKDWFRAVAPKVIPPMHKAMNKLTRGRFVPGELVHRLMHRRNDLGGDCSEPVFGDDLREGVVGSCSRFR